MTHQFKFGDRVKYRATDFLFIHDKGDGFAHVVSKTGVSGAALISDLTLIPHPDTARLDWLAAQDDIDITLGNTVQLKPCLRAHIDAAMQEQAAEAKE